MKEVIILESDGLMTKCTHMGNKKGFAILFVSDSDGNDGLGM